MTDTERAALRGVAERATQGEWRADDFTVQPQHNHHSMKVRPIQHGPYGSMLPSDAAHVVAWQPAAALRLLSELDTLRAENEKLREASAPFAMMSPFRPPEGVERTQWARDVERLYSAIIAKHASKE